MTQVRLLPEFDTDVPDPLLRFPAGGPGSVNERLSNALLRHRHYVLMAENGALQQMLEPLREARKTLTEQLATFAARDDAIGDLSRLANERRKVLRRRVDEIVNIAQTDTRKAAREQFRKFARREGEIQENLLRREIPDSVQNRLALDLAGPDLDRLEAIVDRPLGGERWTVRFDRNAAELRKALKQNLGTSVALGEGMDEAARRIRDNVKGIGLNRATLIARTEIQRVANETAVATYQANQDVIKELEWIGTLDGRTCPVCGTLDGETWPVDKPPSEPPPVHPACRCIMAPVTRSWRELGIDRDELPRTTRASMDGQVPASQNYRDWFSRQSADFQRDVLGPARFELFRSGAIDFEDMVKSNRVLNVDELPAATGEPPPAEVPADEFGGLDEDVRRRLEGFEESVRRDGVEKGLWLTDDGEEVVRLTGTAEELAPSGEQSVLIQRYASVMTHNHPDVKSGNFLAGPSPPDLAMMTNARLDELRAVVDVEDIAGLNADRLTYRVRWADTAPRDVFGPKIGKRVRPLTNDLEAVVDSRPPMMESLFRRTGIDEHLTDDAVEKLLRADVGAPQGGFTDPEDRLLFRFVLNDWFSHRFMERQAHALRFTREYARSTAAARSASTAPRLSVGAPDELPASPVTAGTFEIPLPTASRQRLEEWLDKADSGGFDHMPQSHVVAARTLVRKFLTAGGDEAEDGD